MKKSVYLSKKTVEFLSLVSVDAAKGVEWSAGINGSLLVLEEVLESVRPDLTTKEWSSILAIYENIPSPVFDKNKLSPWAVMVESIGEFDLISLKKNDPERFTLIKKLHGLNKAEWISVLFACQTFWNRKSLNKKQ